MVYDICLAHGYLIIGQEQDVLGGRFSQSESFVGNMAYIDVWSRVLTLEEINIHQNDCSDTMLGDLYAWPEMQEHTNGNIKVNPTCVTSGLSDLGKTIYYRDYRQLSVKDVKTLNHCTTVTSI